MASVVIVIKVSKRAHHVFAAVVFTLAVSGVAGCAGGEPAPTLTARTPPPPQTHEALEPDDKQQPLPEAEEELVAPQLPPENQDFDLSGAEATARYYLEAFEYGYASLDSEPLEEISTSNCKTCARHIRKINEFKESNKRLDGGEIAVGDLVDSHDNGNKAVIVISASQRPLRVSDASNAVISTDPGSTANMEFLLTFESSQWRIDAVAADVQNGD